MKLFVTLVISALIGLSAAWNLGAAEPITLESQKDKISYTLGMNIGKQLKQNDVEINLEIYTRGLQDALKGGELLLTEEQARQTMMDFQTELRNRQMAKAKVEAEENKKIGDDFLNQNKEKEGIKTTPSGLQYKILVQGDGPVPSTNDTVVTHYRGTLINGTEFDNSFKRGEPATFPVTGVIKGWTEALLMMPVGSKWQLFIPSDLAYGERGRPSIPPNSTLLFDIELVDIKKPTTPKTGAK